MTAFVDKYAKKLKDIGTEKLLTWLLAVLLVFVLAQGVRYVGVRLLARGLTKSIEDTGGLLPGRDAANSLEKYNAILEKGIIGTANKKGAPAAKLFGIMGSSALLGASADKSKLFSLGDEIPGGEKIVEISANKVVVEKEGNKRTLTVFPDMKKKKGKAEGPPFAPPVEKSEDSKQETKPGEEKPDAPPDGNAKRTALRVS